MLTDTPCRLTRYGIFDVPEPYNAPSEQPADSKAGGDGEGWVGAVEGVAQGVVAAQHRGSPGRCWHCTWPHSRQRSQHC